MMNKVIFTSSFLLLVFCFPYSGLSVFSATDTTKQSTTPSGHSYTILNKGPILGIKSGEKTLGLSYSSNSIADKQKTMDEAFDIMSALLPEAELNGYTAVVVMANEKKVRQ